jgi:ribonucleotide reductase alpha subunit
MQKGKKTYMYNDVYKKTLEYFNGDDLATSVWISKYSLKETDNNGNTIYYECTPTDMFHRLTSELYRAGLKYENPLSYEQIFDLINDFKYIVPQGSPMAGIGNDNDITSLSNCFVISYPEQDSYGTIARVDQEIMQISKRRGGVGTDLSGYRSSNSKVKNAAMTSTGPVEICANRFSNTIREVGQNGRRGALMLSMDIEHKDAESFIDAKMQNGKVTGANISVKIGDRWLNSFLNSNTPNKENERLWEKIIYNAWKSAEPGVLFWDTVINESVPDCYSNFGFKTISTNPCQPEYATVLTPSGIKKFKDVNIGDYIWSETGWTKIINKWSTGVKAVYEYRTTRGVFLGTNNHRVLENGIKTEVENVKTIDNLEFKVSGELIVTNPQDVMDGLVIGDGTVHKASNNLVHLCVGKDDSDYFESEIKDYIIKYRPGLHDYAYEIQTTIKENELDLLPFRKIPERFVYGNYNTKLGFLRGLFSANGSVIKNRVTLKTTSQQLRDQVQLMLSSVGISSYFTTNKSTCVKFENGDYICKESYDINISTDKNKFLQHIGFLQNYKNEKLTKIINNPTAKSRNGKVLTKTFIEETEVFDITVDNETHTYWTGGLNVSNCGEIPLSNKDSCRLMLLNLYNYVKNPFSDNASFDFDLLREHSRKIIKIMDNMIDLEIEKIESIIKKVETDPEDEDTKKIELDLWREIKRVGLLGRRSGIGVTAEADMLAAMGYKYGTAEATDFSVKVHKLISTNVYIGSCNMCQIDNRPTFGVFDWELEKNNSFINRLINSDDIDSVDLKQKIKTGRRNIACLTIPPAGSTSLMTQTTSGIEPLFKAYYNRKRKIDKNSGIVADFIDATGDWFQTYFVIHPKFSVWYAVKNNMSYVDATMILSKMQENELDKLFEISPYYGATSSDVDWVEKVKMQGMVQKYIDHSISATTNIPKDTSKEVVRKIYEEAWRSGCKGMTIYREGSRDGVLTSKKTETVVEKQHRHAEKRPKSLIGKVVRFNNGGEKWVSVVGLLNEKPYEIFTGLLDKLNIPSNIDEGNIIKTKIPKVVQDENGKEVIKQISRYDFQYKTKDGELITVKGLSTTFREEFWNYAKLISGLLRHNMPIEYVVDVISTLNLGGDNINSWKNGVIRTLKKFIKDGVATGEKCPECGGKLVRQSGCISCQDCGYSKC